MGWETSDRKNRLPKDWAAIRQRVLRRDSYQCCARDSQGRRCTLRANDVDHIARGDDHDLSNLQSLCSWHHKEKTAREANSARKRRPTQRREPEPHPGLLG